MPRAGTPYGACGREPRPVTALIGLTSSVRTCTQRAEHISFGVRRGRCGDEYRRTDPWPGYGGGYAGPQVNRSLPFFTPHGYWIMFAKADGLDAAPETFRHMLLCTLRM